ncbi:FAD-binding protein, partial [Streptomyces sp. NPDC056411]
MGRWTTTPATDLGTALLRRGAHGYEEARSAAVWNDRKPDRFPAALVRAASEDDVVRAVAHARERGLRVTVRSGGHNWSGAPLRDDALLLDVSGLRDLALTPGSDGG